MTQEFKNLMPRLKKAFGENDPIEGVVALLEWKDRIDRHMTRRIYQLSCNLKYDISGEEWDGFWTIFEKYGHTRTIETQVCEIKEK